MIVRRATTSSNRASESAANLSATQDADAGRRDKLRGATLFSGIGAPECAAPFVDWRWCAEIDPFPSAVHAARFPGIPNHGDVAEIDPDAVEPVDLVVFGSPCQSFSVAGKRLGLDDPRGNMALVALRLAARLRPTWICFENVPGLLSSDGGRDFGAFLGLLGECGYGFAYRVLDAQYAGVPQRRRRVFVVGYLGDWRPPAAVLFERESLQGHPPPRRETGQGVAVCPTLRAGGNRTGGDRPPGTDVDTADSLVVASTGEISHRLNAGGMGRQDYETETLVTHALRAEGFDASENGTGRGTSLVPVAYRTSPNCGAWETGERTDALTTGTDPNATVLAFDTTQITSKANRSNPKPGDPCHPLEAGDHAPAVAFIGETNASTQKADAGALLRALREQVGAEAFAEWRSGILDSLQRPEVLRQTLHGRGVRCAARKAGCWVDDGSLPRAEDLPAGALRQLWEDGPDGRSPQGRELAEQLAGQSGATLPLLSHPHSSAVRRLTPREAERLQGFPDDWTAIQYRGKPAADGPRYKALGNSMAVPVMRDLLTRIRDVDAIIRDMAHVRASAIPVASAAVPVGALAGGACAEMGEASSLNCGPGETSLARAAHFRGSRP